MTAISDQRLGEIIEDLKSSERKFFAEVAQLLEELRGYRTRAPLLPSEMPDFPQYAAQVARLVPRK